MNRRGTRLIPILLVALVILTCRLAHAESPGWRGGDFVEVQSEHAERVRKALDAFAIDEAPGVRGQADPESALLAVEDMAIAQVEIRARPGSAFRAPLAIYGARMTLDLAPQSYRAQDFRVELLGPGGTRTLLDPGPVRTLLGAIPEIPGSLVAGSLLESGLEVMIRLPDETTLWVEPASKHVAKVRPDLYVASICGLGEGAGQVCGMKKALPKWQGRLRSISAAATTGENCGNLGGCVADLLCDTDSSFYQGNNSNPAQVQATVESIIALVNPRYAELHIRHRISRIVIRPDPATDPYADPGIDLLTRMSEIWGAGTHTSDLVHLFGRGSPTTNGMAWPRGVCGYGYMGMYSWSSGSGGGCTRAGLVMHELGHSWGAEHSTGIMDQFARTCESPWSDTSRTEISNRRNQVDGICLDLDNQPPTARFSFTCSGLSCSFNASSSTDDHGIVSYSWAFGDSTSGFGVAPSHAYAATGTYTVTLTVTDAQGLQSSKSKKVSVTDVIPGAAESYFSVPPCRIADTRNTTPLSSGAQRLFQVTGLCGIPASAKAVSFNVTVVSPTGSGYLVFFPGNQTSGPFAHSTINFDPANSPRANNANLRLATNGTGSVNINPYVAGSPGQVHVILDVYGYFSEDATPAPGAQGPLGFQTLTPCRIADTRTGTPIAVGTTRNFTVQGVCGVPMGAVAAPLNLTIISPTAGGHAPLFQAGVPPGMPTINFNVGVVLTNGTRIRLAPTTPDVSVNYYSPTAGASTHAVIDVFGYFKSDAPLKYRPITACRAVDTRFADQGGPAALGAPETRNFQIRGNCGVPTSAKAVAVNITSVGSAGPGYLSASPSGAALPAASYLTFDPGQGVLANGGVVALSTLPDDLAVTTANSTHVIIDVFGYFQ